MTRSGTRAAQPTGRTRVDSRKIRARRERARSRSHFEINKGVEDKPAECARALTRSCRGEFSYEFPFPYAMGHIARRRRRRLLHASLSLWSRILRAVPYRRPIKRNCIRISLVFCFFCHPFVLYRPPHNRALSLSGLGPPHYRYQND